MTKKRKREQLHDSSDNRAHEVLHTAHYYPTMLIHMRRTRIYKSAFMLVTNWHETGYQKTFRYTRMSSRCVAFLISINPLLLFSGI